LLGGMCSAHLDAARSNGEGPKLVVLGVQNALEQAVAVVTVCASSSNSPQHTTVS